METNTCYLGIDLNDAYAMVSFFQPDRKEPETVSTIAGSEEYRIPTLLARRKNIGMWYYGEEAGRMAKTSEVICVDSLLKRAMASEVITIAKESYAAVELLAFFLKKVIELPQKLGNTAKAAVVVLTVERLTKETAGMYRKVGQLLELSEEQFLVTDYKESFYAFVMHQEKALWLHDVLLFSCEGNRVGSMTLTRDTRTKPQRVRISVSGEQQLSQERDSSFLHILQQELENRTVSSVYLVGDGFDGDWMKQSLAVMCRGRRAFMGQNLFSKGACYMAAIREKGEQWPYVYMGENEMKFQLGLQVMDRGKKSQLQLISAGKNWFELQNACEVILDGEPKVAFYKKLPGSVEVKEQIVELTELPQRPERTTRLRITATPLSDDKIEVEIRDLGFGEFFPATDRVWKCTMMM